MKVTETYIKTVEAGPKWYALQVRSRQEKTVAKALEHKNYQVFSPFYTCRSRRSDRIVEIQQPLFRGYVFCCLDINDRCAPVVTTPGVVKLVGTAGMAAPIETADIVNMMRLISSSRVVEPWPWLSAGDTVSIVSGPLAGVTGIYVEQGKQHRLVLSISLLQRSVIVTVDEVDIAPKSRGKAHAA